LRQTLRDVDFVHVEAAVNVAQTGNTGAEATLPRGLRLSVGYSTLTIADQNAFHLPPEKPWLAPNSRIPLSIPGKIDLLGGWCLHAQAVEHWNLDLIAENNNPYVAWIDADHLGNTALLRTRQRGDRFQPQGMQGATVRLSDLLINAKIPRPWRNYLPLLEADGRILWVSGLRLSEIAKVRPTTQRVVYLRFTSPSTNKELP
jgi:tRNA(Ile)-lysidine synthetase-like protein